MDRIFNGLPKVSEGALCIFEDPSQPDIPSRPRYTPAHDRLVPKSKWNAGQLSDTRYAYDVICNGPIRSMIRIKGMNWDSGSGFYEYEQYYTIYAGTHYTVSKVNFTTFQPRVPGVEMGCGIRQKPEEDNFIQRDGLVITSGPEYIRDPEEIDNRGPWRASFIGMALAVKEEYKPQYKYVPTHSGNHVFKITPDAHKGYEYMVMASWAEGPLYNDKESFSVYAGQMYQEYNNPPVAHYIRMEEKK